MPRLESTSNISLINSCLKFFTVRDKFLLAILVLTQLSLISLDVLGVIMISAVVGIGVSAIRGTDLPSWADSFASSLSIEDWDTVSFATLLGSLAAVFFILKSVFSFYLMFRSQRYLAGVEIRITNNLATKLLTRDLSGIKKYSTQEYQHSLTSGVNSITTGVIGQSVSLISEVGVQLAMTITLFFFSPVLTFSVFLFFIFLFFFLNTLQGTTAQSLGRDITNSEVKSLASLTDIMSGYREILVAGKIDFYIKRFSESRKTVINLSIRKNILIQLSKYIFEVSFVLVGLWIAGFSFYLYSAEEAATLIVVFLAASSRISTSILRLQYGFVLLKGYGGSTALILQIFSELDNEIAKTDSSSVNKTDLLCSQSEVSAICFKNLTFTYPGGFKPTLNNISFEVTEKQSIALVGPSGAGKSTIADLIIGALTPDSGERNIFGNEPRSYFTLNESGIAYVPQEVYLQQTSIIENIALGVPSDQIDVMRVKTVLDTVHLLNLIEYLPSGIDTIIGYNGFNLSGGQRQRIGIARALYRNPRLLVLDEATSSLDAEMEDSIGQTISSLRNQLTTIVIAHRLSTVMNCDRIFYIDKGQITASGTFDELRNQIRDFDTQANLMGIRSK